MIRSERELLYEELRSERERKGVKTTANTTFVRSERGGKEERRQ